MNTRAVLRGLAIAILILTAWVVGTGPAAAHRLNLFAVFDGTRIVGEAYFSSGARARGVEVRAFDASDKVVATTRTDDKGSFSFPPLPAVDLELVVDTGDGHVATFRVSASEMGGGAVPGTGPAGSGNAAADGGAATVSDGLEQVVDRAVARRIAPLRQQIADYEARVRLHDILGGLGYLAGIAGLGFWLLARREAKGRGK